ncbi:MAG: acyltransferase [Lachnospiraceae bacterium]|nr:acyltransferase [Lachnospiraceae bacterium]
MKKYFGIDWLRTIACIGIALMHIRANCSYEIIGFAYNKFVPSLTDFVYLFMAISSFGMCCGYYEKVMSGMIDWTDFYKKRYIRILPFFALLIFIDVIMSFNVSSLLEGFTEITLLHGFVPQELSVIGVGWYLGTVFIFYLIFPFFCVLIEKKSRAWCAFGISLVLHYICACYFELDRHNFLFSFCYFLIGGLVYLYKDILEKIRWYIYLPVLIIVLFIYYATNTYGMGLFFLVFVLLSFAISIKRGKNKIVSFISGISMEIYLSHMVMFRVIEKMNLNYILGNGWGQYIFSSLLVIVGAVCFSYVIQNLINRIEKRVIG